MFRQCCVRDIPELRGKEGRDSPLQVGFWYMRRVPRLARCLLRSLLCFFFNWALVRRQIVRCTIVSKIQYHSKS